MMQPKQSESDVGLTDPEYQNFTMVDFDQTPSQLLVQIDYLVEMFDLEVLNEKGHPLVITLREKPEHAKRQQEGDGII